MKVELFPFQQKAVGDMRTRAALAIASYRDTRVPQVLSLQAPTGSGKTIIMSALIEEIYFGSDKFMEQPDAIFVWLSDSPALNEQSKQKIDLKADKVRLEQCVTLSDESFDMEELQDGHIYFLNTQKLSKAGNLGRHSDLRQYTIWETLANTARNKSNRLYFIIDEAHRGMQGYEAGKATSIMQRFLKGSPAHNLPPMPVVIGMSATAERFNKLVGNTSSSLHKVVISSDEVRASGLLKDRILITYPEDPAKHNDMAVLQAAADEWKNKCEHWSLYCCEQHYAMVNPVFVIQVQAGAGNAVSNTDLDNVVAKIEESAGVRFNEHEVVHTFGSAGTIQMNGLNVHHVEPSGITDDKRIKVVMFKENLSTGWDCPRAETMMSFRHAEDSTYIAQLLGRMVRTPLQRHILADDYLNDVRLYLPYFDSATVSDVVNELQNAEGGEIPTVVDSESFENTVYTPWTIHTNNAPKKRSALENISDRQQGNLFNIPMQNTSSNAEADKYGEPKTYYPYTEGEEPSRTASPLHQPCPQTEPFPTISAPSAQNDYAEKEFPHGEQRFIEFYLDREKVTKFINEQGFLTYTIRTKRIHNYLRSLIDLASLLTYSMICPKVKDDVYSDVVTLIHTYTEELRQTNEYDRLAQDILHFKLFVDVFNVFGESMKNYRQTNLFSATDYDIDQQLRAAESRLGNYGFCNRYGRQYFDVENPNTYKIDCILFASNESCIERLYRYAEKKFHELNDSYRRYIVGKSEKCRLDYDNIVANSDFITKHNFSLPEIFYVKDEESGRKYYNHLYADADGVAKIKLNSWEEGVIEEESERDDFVCWLRNQSRCVWSLCLPYEDNGQTKAMYPDFIIVRKDKVLEYVIDILEPHNPALDDNLSKAKALAQYVKDEPKIGRVELIRKEKDITGKNRFKRLDISKSAVYKKILNAVNNDELDHIFETDGFFTKN